MWCRDNITKWEEYATTNFYEQIKMIFFFSKSKAVPRNWFQIIFVYPFVIKSVQR